VSVSAGSNDTLGHATDSAAFSKYVNTQIKSTDGVSHNFVFMHITIVIEVCISVSHSPVTLHLHVCIYTP